MKNKRFITLILAMVIILVPISTTAQEIEVYSNKDITILNDDIYNLIYTQKTDDGLYKIVEHMTEDLKNVESNFYKLNIETNEFEHKKYIESKISDDSILRVITENGITVYETYDISDCFDLNYNEENGKGSIRINAYDDWHTTKRSGDSYIGNATISATIQALGTLIGGLIGSALGMPISGGAVGTYLGTIAEKIVMRNVKTVYYESTVRWKYRYPRYDYDSTTYFYDESGGYLGTSYDDGSLIINM
ncbi:hypothetical protein KQI41_17995 [Tissierella pigra]|uniref:Glycine zipper domain-containing protein n=1 Tax=Tissierella pigra TaxID=2607614 RepID=A0A6N7Y4T3_9FIRM|nr:hypothetical protein [Tissierella pigra]MBU5428286.1 hypothetical protein [Tissierella pigra]MSU03458.1 hypothetical protein [Tissierella pigra]